MKGIRLSNAFLVFVIFLSHFFAPEGYLFYQHTMSEMAAQFAPNAWILTLGFVGAGIGYLVFSTQLHLQKLAPRWLTILVMANGLSLILLAFFPTSYDGFTQPANETIVVIHRYIAYVSNILTMISILLHAFFSTSTLRVKHLLFFTMAIVFSAFFIYYDQSIRGLFQRFILLTTSSWTWFYFGSFNPSLEKVKQPLL